MTSFMEQGSGHLQCSASPPTGATFKTGTAGIDIPPIQFDLKHFEGTNFFTLSVLYSLVPYPLE